jgi:hypothetical protein
VTRSTPSAALLDRLARRFAQSPGHAAWRARQAGSPVPDQGPAPPARPQLVEHRKNGRVVMTGLAVPPAGRASTGTGLPACWSACD